MSLLVDQVDMQLQLSLLIIINKSFRVVVVANKMSTVYCMRFVAVVVVLFFVFLTKLKHTHVGEII